MSNMYLEFLYFSDHRLNYNVHSFSAVIRMTDEGDSLIR